MKRRRFHQYEMIDEGDHNDNGAWQITEQAAALNKYSISGSGVPVIFEGLTVTQTGGPNDHVLIGVGYGVQIDGKPLIQDTTISATIDVDCSAGTPGDYGHIEIRYLDYSGDSQNRTFINALGATIVAAVDKLYTSQISAQYVLGGAGGAGAITAGWVKIAEVKQVAGTIVNADIKNVDAYYSGVDNTGWTADKQATIRMRNAKAHRDIMDHKPGTVDYTHLNPALQALISDTAATIERQAIINGDFDFWQRAISGVGVTTSFLADRWLVYENVGAATMDAVRSASPPTEAQSGHASTYCLQMTVTANAAPGAAESCVIRYCVEGYDFAALKGKTVTLSFWARSSVAGIYCVSFQNGVASRSYIVEYTIAVANTWEKKTVSVVLTEAFGAWLVTNGTGLRIYFTLAAGASYQDVAGSWVNNDQRSTVNQTQWINNMGATFRLAQVQLNTGAAAYSFTRRPIEAELAACQRYCEKSYDVDVVPTTATAVGSEASTSSATIGVWPVRFKIKKRATAPSVVVYGGTSGTAGFIWDVTGAANVVIAVTNEGETGFTVSTAAAADQHLHNFHWLAESELA